MIRPDPSKIVVPRKHGEVLIEPSMGALADGLAGSSEFWREGGPGGPGGTWREGRAEARRGLLEAAREWAKIIDVEGPQVEAVDKPWVITGHQVEFYHAGVWAKVVAADELARRAEAVGIDLLVDHDVVERMGFDVPVERGDGGWGRVWQGVSGREERNELSAESLSAPDLAGFEAWDATLAEYTVTQTDTLAFILTGLRRGITEAGGRGRQGYTGWMSRARVGFERSLGLEVHHVPATWVCRGQVWERFVGMWIEHAAAWTEAYNRHLAGYRARQGIKNVQHPMPDLARGAGAGEFELPFWVYRRGEARERMVVRIGEQATAIVHRGKEYPIVAGSGMTDGDLLLRPRALTLTMYVRLFLADVFIHGIGGALYDQITDGLLQELFGVVPPYGCVSAAWLLPLGTGGRAMAAEDVAALRWQRHHVRHNPQLAIDPFTALRTEVAELIRARRERVEQIAGSLGTARRDAAARSQRRAWFGELHAINRALHERAPRILARLDREIEEAQGALEENKVLLWREWYLGLHTTQSLEELVRRIRQ